MTINKGVTVFNAKWLIKNIDFWLIYVDRYIVFEEKKSSSSRYILKMKSEIKNFYCIIS